jgi:hypothetical protein
MTVAPSKKRPHLIPVKFDKQHGRLIGLDHRLSLVVQPITSGSLVLHM